MDKYSLPTSTEINGITCEFNTDYRDILYIFKALNDPDLLDQEKVIVALDLFYKTDDYKVDQEKAVKEFIESFEKDENNIEIKNRLNRLMEEILIKNIDKIHTTDMGVDRIRRNLGLGDVDVVSWCKERVLDKTSIKERQGKNWYVRADGCVITINASSYTIITCHKE